MKGSSYERETWGGRRLKKTFKFSEKNFCAMLYKFNSNIIKICPIFNII